MSHKDEAGRGSRLARHVIEVGRDTPTAALSFYDTAAKALVEAKRLDEVKDIADKATALKEYARRANDREMEIDAAELRIRAERRLGEMLKKTPLNKGGGDVRAKAVAKAENTGSPSEPVKLPPGYVPKWNEPALPTLEEIGIDKKLSMRSQKIASISERAMEARLATWRQDAERGAERVTVNIMKQPTRKTRVQDGRMEIDRGSGV
jgi:hypothetical protein